MKKSSVITPPPPINDTGNVPTGLSEDARHEEFLKLVRKGAPSLPREQRVTREDNRRKVTIRLDDSVVRRFKEAVNKRPVKTPENTWLTEAVFEKLKREGL